MSEWILTTIGDVATVYDGPHATPNKTETGPWFLSISSLDKGRLNLAESAHVSEEDFGQWTRRVTPREGDVLFSYETRLGEAALMPSGIRACLGRRMGILRPKAGCVDPKFLLYAYLGPEFQTTIAARTIHGATVDRIPLVSLPTWPIRLPGLAEQQAVVSVLGALDDKIAVNERIEAIAQELLSQLFAYHVWNYGRSADLPDGFTEGTVRDICKKIGNGGTPKRKNLEYWREGDVAWYKTGELFDGPLLYSSELITDLGVRESSCSVWPARTVLVALYASPTVGRLGILESPAAFNQACSGLLAKDGFGELFVFETLKATRGKLQSIAVGSAQQNISQRILSEHRVVIPTREVAAYFNGVAQPLYRRRVAAAQESRILAALRDTLLPQLMSGRLRVQDAEKIVEDHT